MAYPGTNVFVLVFAVNEPCSLDQVRTRWYPEIVEDNPGGPIVLVGCKSDLREDQQALRDLEERGEKMLMPEDGQKLAKEIQAFAYVECSQKKNEGFQELRETLCRVQICHQFVRVPKMKRRRKAEKGNIQRALLAGLVGKKKKFRSDDAYRRELLRRSDEVLKRYRGLVVRAHAIEEKRLKSVVARRMRDARLYCEQFVEADVEKQLPKLSWDVVKHLLHKFVLIDVELHVPAFQTSFWNHHEALGLSRDPVEVTKLFFGVKKFGASREFFQVFANFSCDTFRVVRLYLPKFMRSLRVRQAVSLPRQAIAHLLYGSKNFYAQSAKLKKVLSLPYRTCVLEDVNLAGADCPEVKMVLLTDESHYHPHWKNVLTDISSLVPNVRSLTLTDGRGQRVVLEGHEFSLNLQLPHLTSLAISGLVLQPAFRFEPEFFPALRRLVITLPGKDYLLPTSAMEKMTLAQLEGIQRLPCLETVLLNGLDLRDVASMLMTTLLSEKQSLCEVAITGCEFDYSLLSSCIFRDVPRLSVFILLHFVDSQVQAELPSVFRCHLEERARAVRPVEAEGTLLLRAQTASPMFVYHVTWGSGADGRKVANPDFPEEILRRCNREFQAASEKERV